MTGALPRRRPARGSLALAALLGVAIASPTSAAPPPGAEAGHPAVSLEESIRRGVAHLVASQRKDGSWGSTASNLWDIYAPVPGSFVAFQVAVTGLATTALLEAGGDDPAAKEAVRRATDYLLANHAKARRVSPDTMYNVWSNAYALEAFARLLAREKDEARRKALLAEAKVAVELLDRFESVNGGWGYYDFDGAFRKPGQFTTSFTTATVLVALKDAEAQGVAVPERLVRRGVALVEALRTPRGSFAYSWDHRFYPHGGINKTKGSLARTPACLLSLARSGKDVPDACVVKALDELTELGHFLRIARKYPIPHETWYQNSGYFCFYGYRYAAQLMERLPVEARGKYRQEIVARLVPLQEEDGSFWDYQLYGYHKAYGTAYVLMALARCRP